MKETTSTTLETIAKGIEEHFRQVHQEYAEHFPDFVEFLRHHLFFITLTYRPGLVSIAADSPLHPLRLFGRLYFNIGKSLLGDHLCRKRMYQPLTYVGVDFEGSKTGYSADTSSMQMLHVHALMLVRPDHLAQFLRNERNIRTRWIPGAVDSVDFRRFDPSLKDLHGLIDYCMKGAAQAERASFDVNKGGRTLKGTDLASEQMWSIFPSPDRMSKRAAKDARRVKRSFARPTQRRLTCFTDTLFDL